MTTKNEDALTAAGAMLANCAFNLAQRHSPLTERERRSLDESRKAWDAALADWTQQREAGAVHINAVEQEGDSMIVYAHSKTVRLKNGDKVFLHPAQAASQEGEAAIDAIFNARMLDKIRENNFEPGSLFHLALIAGAAQLRLFAASPSASGGADMDMVEEGLCYFDLAGDDGDKRYVNEIRKALAAISFAHPAADKVPDEPLARRVLDEWHSALGGTMVNKYWSREQVAGMVTALTAALSPPANGENDRG